MQVGIQQPNNMKIVFLHVYSEYNTGDAAIVSVMLDDYRTRYPDAEIYLSSITKPHRSSFKNAPYISSFFREAIYTTDSKWRKIIQTIFVSAGVFFHILFYKKIGWFIPFYFSKELNTFVKHIMEADLIVGVGGGYIIGKKGIESTVSLFLTLLEFWFCKRLAKKVYLYSQSIGPFDNRFQKKMAKYVLNQIDQITVREDISRNLLTELDITVPHIKRGYDAAFYFTARTKTRMMNYLMKRGVFFTKPVLGITVRKCFNDELQQTYEQSIATVACYAQSELNYKVVFIPHVTATEQNDDDRDVEKSIQNHLKRNRDIIFLQDRFSFEEIKGLYDNLDFLIGTRMHSVIFSLTAKVPSIAIAYEPKTVGIMKQLGLERWVIMSEEVTGEKLKTFLAHLSMSKSNYFPSSSSIK